MCFRFKISILFLLVITVLTGCWSRRELNDLAIVVAIGIDQAENGQYLVSAQVVNPAEIASQSGSGAGTINYSPITTYQAKADTIVEALRKITTVSPRKIYVSHIRMLVIGEEVAKNGIANVLDFFSRDHEFRTDFFITVTKDTTAEKVLSVYTELEKIPANKLFNSLEMSERYWAPTRGVFLDELLSDLILEGKEPVLTAITITGDYETGEEETNVQEIIQDAQLKYENIGVFKKDKLVGWLNTEESKGFNYITGTVNNTVGHMSCPDGGKFSKEQIVAKSKITPKIVNGKPEIFVHIWTESNIAEVNCQIDLSKMETIKQLEKLASGEIEKHANLAIEKAQKEFQSDIFGFGDLIYRKNPKTWKKLKDHWDEAFSAMPVHVKVDVHIRRFGTIENSFLEELNSTSEEKESE
ncbi:Ger(x)C family spore germination protein [Fervidibacillus halotolerans]|uniref:Ger(X)C family spore germination protein n=1 Tax=Fervidibacillus halotolerans TaxID=2980027 RepID=A0A9E8LZZ9_9BACI|nr:Ger(x)C family spore germination protein [Fervidibacillus halotolerans]WAA12709.1 Ger(x)C family spore germination protein [Fervidibacillus halotolerans]